MAGRSRARNPAMRVWRSVVRWARRAGALGHALVFLSPVTGVIWIAGRWIGLRGQPQAHLLRRNLLLISPLLLLSVTSLIVGRPGLALSQLLQALLGWFALGARANRRALRVAALAALVILSSVATLSSVLDRGVWERQYSSSTATMAGLHAGATVFRLGEAGQNPSPTRYTQTWRVGGTKRAGIEVWARLARGTPGVAWMTGDTGHSDLNLVSSGSIMTVSTKGLGGGSIERAFVSQSPLGGQQIRVAFEMRGDLGSEPATACHGVAVQIRDAVWTGTCIGVSDLDSGAWRSFSGEWRVPAGVTAHDLWLELPLGTSGDVSVRSVAVSGRRGAQWTALAPSVPTGVALAAAWSNGRSGPATFQTVARVIPDGHWQRVQLDLPTRPSGSNLISIRATVERGIVANVAVAATNDSASLQQELPLKRQSLWFGDPNLFGHTAAIATMVGLVSGGTSLAWVAAPVVAGLPALVTSGSRAALVAVGGAALVFLVSRSLRGRIGIELWCSPLPGSSSPASPSASFETFHVFGAHCRFTKWFPGPRSGRLP